MNSSLTTLFLLGGSLSSIWAWSEGVAQRVEAEMGGQIGQFSPNQLSISRYLRLERSTE